MLSFNNMGSVININHHCCIHDSTFKDECEKKENIETIEKEAMKLGERVIETTESFITEVSPSRKHSKSSNVD